MVKKYAYNKSYKEKEDIINEKTSSTNGSVEDVQAVSRSEYEALEISSEYDNVVFYVTEVDGTQTVYKGRKWLPSDSANVYRWLRNPNVSETTVKRVSGNDSFISDVIDQSIASHNVGNSTEAEQPKHELDAISFDGSDDYLEGADTMLTAGDFSVFFKMKAQTPTSQQCIIAEGNNASANVIYAFRSGNGTTSNFEDLTIFFRDDSSSTTLEVNDAGTLFDNLEHTVGIIKNGDDVTVNIDGVENTFADSGLGTYTVTHFVMGANKNTGIGSFLEGLIYETIMIERAVDEEEKNNILDYLSGNWIEDIVISSSGQSNCEGFPDALIGSYDDLPKNLSYWKKDTQQWAYIEANKSFITYAGIELAKRYPNNNVRIIKDAFPGEPIENWEKGSVAGNLESWITTTNEALATLKNKSNVDGFMWHQGESDSGSWQTYFAQINDVISNMRSESFANTNTPFVAGKMTSDTSVYDYSNINSVLEQLNSDGSNTTATAQTDYPTSRDGAHFYATDYKNGGTLYADIMELMLKGLYEE